MVHGRNVHDHRRRRRRRVLGLTADANRPEALALGRVIAIYVAAGASIAVTFAVVYAIFWLLDGLTAGG